MARYRGLLLLSFSMLVCLLAATAVRADVAAVPIIEDGSSSYNRRIFSADEFVDSEGVNAHFDLASYTTDRDLPKMIRRLGVRHVRVPIVLNRPSYVAELNSIASAANVTFDLLADAHVNLKGSTQSSTEIASFVAAVPRTDALEAPNEVDKRGEGWKDSLVSFLPSLRAAQTGVPIVGPALTTLEAYDLLGDIAPMIDISNIHNYFSNFEPETKGFGNLHNSCGPSHQETCGRYGSIEYAVSIAQLETHDKPIYATETGYGTDPEQPHSVSETMQGKLIPRLLFNQYVHGISRTYVYQLADLHRGGQFGGFGLLKSSADYRMHSAKPAYSALESINRLLGDPGKPFALTPLGFQVISSGQSIHSAMFEKRDRSYWLAIWSSGASDINSDSQTATAMRSTPVTVHLAESAIAETFSLDGDGHEHEQHIGRSNMFAINATDSVTLMKLLR